MGYGILAHTVGKLPLHQLVDRLGNYNIDFVQLALSKAIADIDTGLGKLSPGLANSIAEQFLKQGIRIGVLGCYINPIHPDPQQRRNEIERFKEHIRFARDFGTSIVATETGDHITYRPWEPDRYTEVGWSVLKSTIEELAEEAEKWGVYVGLEPVCVHTLSSPQDMASILEEVPSNHIGVVLDPCYLIDQDNFSKREQLVEDAFQYFGNRIVLAHIKDIVYRATGRMQFVKPGNGVFNIAGFLKRLHEYKPYIDISIEDISEDEVNPAIHYVKGLTY